MDPTHAHTTPTPPRRESNVNRAGEDGETPPRVANDHDICEVFLSRCRNA